MGMPPEAELETFDYTDFGVGIRYLAQQLVDAEWIPDAILGVVRGGLFVAAGIAYALDIKDVRHVNVEFYTDAGETLPEPVLIGQEPYLADLGGKRVLVADDVADTGATLHFVRQLLPADADVRVAVLYSKPATTYLPELAWRTTNKWIRFPWIQVPPIRVQEAGRSSVSLERRCEIKGVADGRRQLDLLLRSDETNCATECSLGNGGDVVTINDAGYFDTVRGSDRNLLVDSSDATCDRCNGNAGEDGQ